MTVYYISPAWDLQRRSYLKNSSAQGGFTALRTEVVSFRIQFSDKCPTVTCHLLGFPFLRKGKTPFVLS